LFQPIGDNGALKSDISINFSLYSSTQDKSIADSGTYSYEIYKNTAGATHIIQIPIRAETGNSYTLKIVTKDKFKKSSNLAFLEVEKTREIGQQYFNLTEPDGNPLFKNAIMGNSPFRLLHTSPSSDKLYISFYKNDTPLPKPTFAVNSDEYLYGRPDTVYVLDYSPNLAINFAEEGMYFLQFDTTLSEGVAITRFSDDFPKISNPYDMLEPLAYITTSAEYDKLLAGENKKLAADNFWIKAGGSTGRGREMIRVYYNRVYFANYYFTNTKPGWKTDRGMVYIVYGAPQYIKKDSEWEIWYYYINKGSEAISFKFNYAPNKFNLNQYILERSESQTWHWREAVYAWTNGEIYLMDK
jgi:GWxTD domain-containing protein